MLGRLRRAFSRDATTEHPRAASGPRGEPLTEGVYAGGRSSLKHYAKEGGTRTLCGGSPARLHRWSSAWYLIEPEERCSRCDALVGERGRQPHGPPTWIDLVYLGLEMPPGLPRRQRALYLEMRESYLRRKAAEPPPPAPDASFDDPPFVYLEDPAISKQRVGSDVGRVLNDVYARNKNGKKWHRVYTVGQPYSDERMSRYGRSFALVCGGGAAEFEPDDNWVFSPTALRTDVPPPDEICKLCRQSDAKYGKGEIPNKFRWDR